MCFHHCIVKDTNYECYLRPDFLIHHVGYLASEDGDFASTHLEPYFSTKKRINIHGTLQTHVLGLLGSCISGILKYNTFA